MNIPDVGEGEVRIGVSLAVPEPFATTLANARTSFSDPLGAVVPPHVTLLPPTLVPKDSLDEISAHLDDIANTTAPFIMTLRGTGTFRPVSDVVFIQVVQGIANCEQLEARVRSGLLAQDLRFNYHPHVTVAHDVPSAELDRAFDSLATFKATYAAEEFRLDLLGDDSSWTALKTFSFLGLRSGE